MTDTVAAAYISVAGAVIVAVAGAIAQVRITKAVIRAERERVHEQIAREADVRKDERREERLLEAVAELLAASDPDGPGGGPDASTAILIPRVQLLLDVSNPDDKALNHALNRLGIQREEFEVRGDPTR